MFLVRSSLAKAIYALHFLTCASSAITPQPITVYFLGLLSQSQVLNCCGVLRLTLIVRFFIKGGKNDKYKNHRTYRWHT